MKRHFSPSFFLPLPQAHFSLRYPDQPIYTQSPHGINHNIHQDNPQIPPSILVLDVDRAEILIRIAQLAKFTVLGAVRIDQVPTGRGGVGGHVRAARLARRRKELDIFIGCTLNLRVGYTGRKKAGCEPRERRDVIHECPETGQGSLFDEDAVFGARIMS